MRLRSRRLELVVLKCSCDASKNKTRKRNTIHVLIAMMIVSCSSSTIRSFLLFCFRINFYDVQCAIAHTVFLLIHSSSARVWSSCTRLADKQRERGRDRERERETERHVTTCESRVCWNCLCGTAQTRQWCDVAHIYYVMDFVVAIWVAARCMLWLWLLSFIVWHSETSYVVRNMWKIWWIKIELRFSCDCDPPLHCQTVRTWV